MKPLVIIPVRGGSKGIPYKNIKPLNNKPLVYYSIDCARQLVPDDDICISTEDPKIIKCVEDYGLKVPFVRPQELATDTAGSYEVLVHAFEYYRALGRKYDCIILLQATSPFRTAAQVKEALALYNENIDMVVSVKKSATNPYYNCFEEDSNGLLQRVLKYKNITRRQDAPTTYEYNGSIYIINPESLMKTSLGNFQKRIKYEMDELYSLDVDTPIDWLFAEFVIKEHLIK